MNTANAFGFLGLGSAMWVLPLVFPAWFPHVAVDGSSTRALWVQVMALVQVSVGTGFLIHEAATWVRATASALVRRGALATAEWQSDGWPETVVTTGGAAALRRALSHASVTEDRITDFVTRSARAHLAARATSIGGYVRGDLPPLRQRREKVLEPVTA